MKDILIILPTRGRPEKVMTSIESWKKTTEGYSRLLVAIDEDDPRRDEYVDALAGKVSSVSIYHERMRMCPRLNAEALNHLDGYKYIGFIGDDHVFRTPWETKMMDAIGDWGIAYGDDLLAHEELPTACVMSSNIIKTLGRMTLPGQIHLFLDNYWKALGEGMGRLFYLPNVIIEHMHRVNGKSPSDAQYDEANSSSVLSHDQQIFTTWHDEGQREKDIATLKEAMSGV